MKIQPGTAESNSPIPVRGGAAPPEFGPAIKRDLLLKQVRAARKRLASTPRRMPKLR